MNYAPQLWTTKEIPKQPLKPYSEHIMSADWRPFRNPLPRRVNDLEERSSRESYVYFEVP